MRRKLTLCLGLVILAASLTSSVAGMDPFIRGDANFDGSVNIADAVGLLAVLFSGADPLQCDDAGDVNDDAQVNIADAIYLLAALFSGGPSPLAPYPTAGFDPTTNDPWDCGDEPVATGPGDIVRIAAGADSNALEADYVIRDLVAWETFWADHASPTDPVPSVDFSTDIVLAVVRSFFNGTHCIEILDANDTAIVDVRLSHWMLPCAPLIIPTDVYDIVVWEDAQGVPDPLIFDVIEIDTCPLVCP